MQVYALIDAENRVRMLYPSDISEEMKTQVLSTESGCRFSTNTIESPEPNEDFSNVLYPHHVSVSGDTVAVMTDAEKTAANTAQQARFELDELREERNKKIAETDWWAGSDHTMTQAQIDYRQALRDITDTYSSLDTVVWPVKP